ncbi:retrovirus-related pol polyprotein from transposon TNT 1-94 [Tanacetum coccineum]
MSNINTNLQTQASNVLYNAIMEAGGKDSPPMLAPGNYKAIERLKQCESINAQDLETNLYWDFGKFTLRDGESLESYYLRFYKMMNELVRNKCDITNHQVNVQFLLQLQQEWQRSQQAATKNRGKAIVNSSPPTYDQEPTMVAEDGEMPKEKEIDKLMALISLSFKKIYKPTNNNLRTSSNTSTQVVHQSGIQCYNCKEYGHVSRECYKPKRAKDVAYHKQKMLLCKQEEARIQLSAEQVDWRNDTDYEPDEQELEAHYMYMAHIQEVTPNAANNSRPIFDAEPLQKVQNDDDNYNMFVNDREHHVQPKSINDTYLEEQGDTNIIIDSSDMSTNEEMVDQDDDDLAKERDLLASLIEKLKCEINDSKTTNQLMFKDLKKFQAELDRYHDVNYASKMEIDCTKAKGQLVQTMNMLNRTCKTSFVKPEFLKKAQRVNPRLYDIGCYNDNLSLMLAPESDETIQEMVADLRYFNSLEHEVDSLKSQLETQKTQFLNEIDRLSREYYYADHMNAILGVYTTLDEFTDLQCDYVDQVVKCERLEKELLKSNITSKSFEALQQHAIDLELALQQCQEQIKNDKAFKENQSKVFLKEREQYFEIQDLKAQLQDKGIAISELKKLIEKMKGKSVETKFEKPSVIRQPNAFKSQRQSVLGKLTTFLDSLAKTDFLKSKSVTTINVSNDFSKPVTTHILPQNVMSILKKTNVIAPGMYKVHTKPNQSRTPQLPQDIRKTNKRVSFSTRVISTTSVSRPQLKSNQLEDRVMYNNSQRKKQQVEDHRRNFRFSNNKTSVTACNDSLNAKTSNVNFVCVTCGKCMVKFGNDQIALILGYGDLGNDILTGSHGIELYSITLQETSTPNLICLMAKATSSLAWLWHHCLSHLNFDTINLLSKDDIVTDLPELKFIKDHLCSSCELGKAKHETHEVLINFLKLVQRGLHDQVRTVQNNKGMKFLNKTLHAYFAQERIEHQTSTARTPEQNGIVERRNRSLVIPLFFWAEAIATICFT